MTNNTDELELPLESQSTESSDCGCSSNCELPTINEVPEITESIPEPTSQEESLTTQESQPEEVSTPPEFGIYSTLGYEVQSTQIKIPLALEGKWYHPRYGDVKISREDLVRMKDNFDSNVLGHSPYITYGHIKDVSPSYSKVDTVDADLKKGDIIEMTIEGNTLFGISNVSNETSSLIESGQYEYNSPEIISNFKSKVNGEDLGPVIMRTSLTNSPFLPMNNRVTLLSQSADASKTLPLIIKLSSTMTESINAESPEVVSQEPKEKETNGNINIAEIIQATTNSLSNVWASQADAMRASYETAIAELQGTVAGLKKDLEAQKKVAFSFSQRLTEEEAAKRNSHLASKGVPPALISKFSLIADSIAASEEVVKFSQGESEIQLSVLQAIEDLLIESCEKVDVKQYGYSAATAPTSLEDQLLELARRNKNQATK